MLSVYMLSNSYNPLFTSLHSRCLLLTDASGTREWLSDMQTERYNDVRTGCLVLTDRRLTRKRSNWVTRNSKKDPI